MSIEDPTNTNFFLGLIPAGAASGGASGPATQIIETSGPTTLSIAGIADGTFLKRVGTTLVGATPAGSGTVTSVDVAVPAAFTSSGGPVTTTGTITIGYSGTAIPIANGGTGATSAAGARGTLGAAASGANSDITSITALSTPLSVAQGGTGAATANAGFNNLSPMTTLGDTIYGGAAGAATRLAGPTSGTLPYVLTSTPSGGVATAPSWQVTVKNNLTAIVDPAVTDDNTGGYSVNSVWINTVSLDAFILVSAATGAAVWNAVRQGSFPYTDVYTAVGGNTWTKRPGTRFVRVLIQGAGGGGGSGAFQLTTVLAGGGGGGGGGDFHDATMPASQTGSTETVTIADGGAGGPAQAVVTNPGTAGSAGTVTSFGTTLKCWVQASGGAGGGAGTSAAGGAAGAGSSNTNGGGAAGGAGSASTSAGTNGTRPFLGGGGGGGGGATTVANAVSNGGGGAFSQLSSSYGSTTGPGVAPGGAGPAGAVPAVAWAYAGGAGGGGGGGDSVAGGVGGAAGYGAGGGGGGGSHTTNSGAGGKGGQGVVVVISS